MIVTKLLKESFLFAYNSVIVNKLRTFLSLLGITIGIFAIISVFTIVDSLEKNIRESIESLGNNVIYVQKWPWAMGADYAWWKYMRRPVPNLNDFEEIKRKSIGAENVAFTLSTGVNVKHGNNFASNTGMWAVSEDFEKIRSFDIEEGRYLAPFEISAGRNVVVIGNEIATQLFPGTTALGKTIQVQNIKNNVIGVFKREGKDNIGGGSLDNFVVLPVNTVRSVVDIRSDRLNPMVMVKAKPNVSIEEMTDELTGILRSVRRLKPSAEDNFALNQVSLISNSLDQIFIVINLAGWVIGGFSILVGGFGIANIMFVSVKERTNIIGIQKALGAKNYFILLQFLFESVLLALLGGILGLMLIFIGTTVISYTTEFNITLTMGNIMVGLFVSGIIGVISGFAPAHSASRLNPVEAINSTF
jgi:putative ABC transport system permease protein